tara:strand:+ start:2015 stop:2542 length:528 start_codon:yes stop_codon:yes gene_type:complete
MANLIILDGLSRTGKTTISNNLVSDNLGRIISLSEKRPEDTDVSSFYKGVGQISNEFYKAFPNETFILDRSFLSELVFAKFFKRPLSVDYEFIANMSKHNKITQFYLYNSHSDYMKRLPKDRHIYSNMEYEKLKRLFALELTKMKLSIETISIDTSKNNINQVYSIIKHKLTNNE